MTRAGVLAGLAAIVVAAVCVRLGFWQLDRLEQRRAFNAAVAAAAAAPPLEIDSAIAEQLGATPEDFLYRRAVVYGSYLPGHDHVLRGRSYQGSPGVHLVSTLALDDTPHLILVNRGWIPSANAATVDPRAFERKGPQRVEGVLQLLPDGISDAERLVIEVEGVPVSTRRRLDRSEIAAELDRPLLPLYLEVTGDGSALEARPPIPVPPPPLDEGPHLGYAIQWFSFAAIAIAGFTTLVFLRR